MKSSRQQNSRQKTQDRFRAHLVGTKLIKPRQTVFVACSGGPDSVALFLLLADLASAWKLKLGLLHVHHGLRGREADKDAAFVRALAKRYKTPIYLSKAPVAKRIQEGRISPEEAARHLRYDYFKKISKKHRISCIVTAHTQDDQAETILMRLMQGTGLRGLQGIRQKMKMGTATFVRPLLPFTKRELLSYLRDHRCTYRRDRSNQSRRFLRNWIRLELFPQLTKRLNPKIIETLARVPAIVSEESKLIEDLEKAAWKKTYKRKTSSEVLLNRNAFLRFPNPLKFRLLDRALRKLDPESGLSFEAWRRLLPELKRTRYRCSLPRDIDLALTPLRLNVYKKKSAR